MPNRAFPRVEPGMAKTKPPADEGLDSLLGELDAMELPPDGPDDPLDGLLDELADFDAPEAAADEAAPEPSTPAQLRKRPPNRAVLIVGLAALASHAALFGVGYWLGGHGAGQGEAGHAEPGEGAAPLEGVMRYIGHPADLRVEDHTVFTNPEVREAVLELNGGQSLADAMAKFATHMKPLGPVTRDGDVIEAKACSRSNCAGEAFTLRYNSHTHQAWVCQTAPYSGGASLSYLYDAEGMEEVARCTDQTPLSVPAKDAAAEPEPSRTDAEGHAPTAGAEQAPSEGEAIHPAHPAKGEPESGHH